MRQAALVQEALGFYTPHVVQCENNSSCVRYKTNAFLTFFQNKYPFCFLYVKVLHFKSFINSQQADSSLFGTKIYNSLMKL
jgi:hypothetical protein